MGIEGATSSGLHLCIVNGGEGDDEAMLSISEDVLARLGTNKNGSYNDVRVWKTFCVPTCPRFMSKLH